MFGDAGDGGELGSSIGAGRGCALGGGGVRTGSISGRAGAGVASPGIGRGTGTGAGGRAVVTSGGASGARWLVLDTGWTAGAVVRPGVRPVGSPIAGVVVVNGRGVVSGMAVVRAGAALRPVMSVTAPGVEPIVPPGCVLHPAGAPGGRVVVVPLNWFVADGAAVFDITAPLFVPLYGYADAWAGRLPQEVQFWHPHRATPDRNRLAKPTTGFLPITIPFPIRMDVPVAPGPPRAAASASRPE
jgi:hypothetical protein